MHLVKGVSAFLRRGSPRHSRGDESDGSGERSTAPSWPDIQFRHFSMSLLQWKHRLLPQYSRTVRVLKWGGGISTVISVSKLGFRECRNEGDEAFLGSLWQDYQEALGLVCGLLFFKSLMDCLSSLSYKRIKWKLDKLSIIVLVHVLFPYYFRDCFPFI
jgi:hypothetical protein